MSVSKNIRHYRRCNVVPIRQFTGSSNAVSPPKMPARTMSLTQWKLLNLIRDYVVKLSSDKYLQNMLNKEIAQLLNRFQPSVYAGERIRFKTVKSTSAVTSVIEQKPEAPKVDSASNNVAVAPGSSSMSNIINGFKLKMGGKEEVLVPAEVVPKWKIEIPVVSKTCITSRTKHLINSIVNAETDESRISRVENLSLHIQQYPEAKNCAVKEGTIRLLLRLRSKTKNVHLKGAVNEVFALLGHTDPLPGKGIRILAIDGGGVRGILVILMLKKFEELTGKRVYEMFDYVCGVSTGAILACTLGLLQKTCDQLHKDYIDISTQVFTQSALKGTSSLVWSHSYYDTMLWEKLLREQMGEGTLISTARIPNSPKLSTLSAVVNHERVSAHVFRNYALPWRVQSQYMGGNNYKVWEAARASAAAPTYFEECRLGNLLHQDGGILVNNPTAVAIHEAKLLWPGSPLQCVVSFGTGRTVPNHIDTSSSQSANTTSWKSKFMKILDSATDTEGVHTMLNDLLPESVYYRFNPYLTEMLSMVEIDPKKIEQLERDAIMYIRRNEDKLQQAAKALLEPRTYAQKGADYVSLQKELLGFTSKL